MHISREDLNPTTIKLTIVSDDELLADAKKDVLRRLGKQMKISGFRPGKAPIGIIERNTDQNNLQSEVLDEAMNRLYGKALETEKVRAVEQPKVKLKKYVPYSSLEFEAEVTVIGSLTLPDYKKIKLAKTPVSITEKDIDEVVHNLQTRMAERVPVERAAKKDDEVVIDFQGIDAKSKVPVRGADGKGYPLLLGSDTFIPGFESNIIGMKVDETKTYTITFPADYGVKALQNRDIDFTVTVTKVHELSKPKIDDAFASKAGPFKSVEALRNDIRKQLEAEKQSEADRKYQNSLVEELAAGTSVAIPDTLIDEEAQRAEDEIRQNLTYRGQTWQEYLDELGQDEPAFKQSLREPAAARVRAGLALTEVAEREGITILPDEFRIRMQLLKGQYTDPSMQAELEKPANVRSIMSAMLTEKTVARLTEYATKA